MSNSSDPYPPIEKYRGITREIIKIIREHQVKLLIVTKSNLVVRDIDILRSFPSAVSISITTLNTELASIIEPYSPPPRLRLEALKILKEKGIPVILRIDPVIPFLTEKDSVEVLKQSLFVDHLVFSTLKLKKDGFRRMTSFFPHLKEAWSRVYFMEGERIQSSWYLNRERRVHLLKPLIELAEREGISWGLCREGFEFSGKSCDGSHLLFLNPHKDKS